MAICYLEPKRKQAPNYYVDNIDHPEQNWWVSRTRLPAQAHILLLRRWPQRRLCGGGMNSATHIRATARVVTYCPECVRLGGIPEEKRPISDMSWHAPTDRPNAMAHIWLSDDGRSGKLCGARVDRNVLYTVGRNAHARQLCPTCASIAGKPPLAEVHHLHRLAAPSRGDSS